MSIRKGTLRVIRRVERETGMTFSKLYSEPHFYYFDYEENFRTWTGEIDSFTISEVFHSVAEMLDFVKTPRRGLLN